MKHEIKLDQIKINHFLEKPAIVKVINSIVVNQAGNFQDIDLSLHVNFNGSYCPKILFELKWKILSAIKYIL